MIYGCETWMTWSCKMIVDIGQVLNLPDIDKYTCCNRAGLEPAPTATP